MHDPRIVRGSVFAAVTTVARPLASDEAIFDFVVSQHALLSPRGNNNHNDKPKKRRQHGKQSIKPKGSLFSQQTVPVYSFTPLSLEENLIEQPRIVSDREVSSQTDEFTRYVTPKKVVATADGKFHRPKVGIDLGTQIEETDRLFNFDAEVKPLLSVLVSKTLAQALAEVKEEEEMANIVHEHKFLLGSKADAERVDRELEDKAKESFRRKEEKKKDQESNQQRIKVMREKVLAWQLARSSIVPDAIAHATRTLEEKGVFYNPLHRDLVQWLAREVYHGSDAKLRLRRVAASLLDELLFNALRRQSILTQLLHQEEQALVRITLRDPITVAVASQDEDGSATSKEFSLLGPVSLSRHDSLELIEKKLLAWVAENVGAGAEIPNGGFLSLLSVAESI